MWNRPIVSLLAFLVFPGKEADAFVPVYPSTGGLATAPTTWRDLTIRPNSSKLFGPDEDYDDDAKKIQEGEALAKQFYEQLRKREGEQQQSTDSTISTPLPSANIGDQPAPTKKKKFTGKPPESAYFGNNDASLLGNRDRGGPRSPREQMMQREFDLVNRAEKGLVYQAGFAALVLVFYLYVGLTGGIQSGGNDYDLGADETIVDELVIPVPKDTEASYWL